jgi:hypothetical protein
MKVVIQSRMASEDRLTMIRAGADCATSDEIASIKRRDGFFNVPVPVLSIGGLFAAAQRK